MARKTPQYVYPLDEGTTFDKALLLAAFNSFLPEATTVYHDLLVVGRLGKAPLGSMTAIRVVLVGRSLEDNILGFEWKDFSLGFLRDMEAVGANLSSVVEQTQEETNG
jgi:hypothetical protein